MWKKTWNLPEGFLIGGGLIVAGLMLELSAGPVAWDAFTWPANAIVLACFVLLIALMHLLRSKVYAFRFLSSLDAAIPALCYATVLTVVMGLTRQTVNGKWLNDMLTFWPFVLIYVYLTVIVGLLVLRRCKITDWRRDLPFLLNHLGLFIVLTTATLGNADLQRMKMITAVGDPEWRVMDQKQQIVELPLAIELQRFIMETYDDGSPKRYASEVNILTATGKNIHTTIDVNKPASVDGWKIYQYGYDTKKGSLSEISIFELVRDPWLPYVYAGIYMMLGGAVLTFILGVRRKEHELG